MKWLLKEAVLESPMTDGLSQHDWEGGSFPSFDTWMDVF